MQGNIIISDLEKEARVKWGIERTRPPHNNICVFSCKQWTPIKTEPSTYGENSIVWYNKGASSGVYLIHK